MGLHKLLPCPACGKVSWCEAAGREQAGAAVTRDWPPPPAGGPSRAPLVQMWIVIAAYGLLWINVAIVGSMAPDRVGDTVLLAVVAAIVPLPAVPFYRFAARYGYRSRVYPLVTALLVVSLALIGGGQYLALAV